MNTAVKLAAARYAIAIGIVLICQQIAIATHGSWSSWFIGGLFAAWIVSSFQWTRPGRAA